MQCGTKMVVIAQGHLCYYLRNCTAVVTYSYFDMATVCSNNYMNQYTAVTVSRLLLSTKPKSSGVLFIFWRGGNTLVLQWYPNGIFEYFF